MAARAAALRMHQIGGKELEQLLDTPRLAEPGELVCQGASLLARVLGGRVQLRLRDRVFERESNRASLRLARDRPELLLQKRERRPGQLRPEQQLPLRLAAGAEAAVAHQLGERLRRPAHHRPSLACRSARNRS
jgi:hypothetical protein